MKDDFIQTMKSREKADEIFKGEMLRKMSAVEKVTLARTLTLTLTLTQTLNPNPNPKPNQAALEGAPGPASRAVAAASKHAASQVSRPPARSNTDSSPTSGLAHASQSQLWAANNKSPDPHELTSQVSRPTSAVGGTSGEPEPG